MKRSLLLSLFVLALLSATPALAATYYVGFCHANSFASISAAVNSPTVAAGSIIKVCPQSYPADQVIINRSLTIEGMTSNNSSMVQFNLEPNGVTVNGQISGINLEPAFWVQSGTLTMSNISILMGFNGQTNCPAAAAGVFFASGASGTLNHVSVAPFAGSPCTIGVWAENVSTAQDSVTIENSTISTNMYSIVAESQQLAGFAPVLAVTITNNLITMNLQGIYLLQTRGTVSGNIINARGEGVNSYAIDDVAPDTTITRNTIGVQGTGIVIGAANAFVTANKIFTNGGDLVPPLINMGCFNGNVTGNTLNGGAGISHVPVGYTGKNTFYNSQFINYTLFGSGC